MESISYEQYHAADTLLPSYIESETQTEIDSTSLMLKALYNSRFYAGAFVYATSLAATNLPLLIDQQEHWNLDDYLSSDPTVATQFLAESANSYHVYQRAQTSLLHEDLEAAYKLVNKEEIDTYLSLNTDLGLWLTGFSSALTLGDGILGLSIEYYRDLEEEWEKLYVTLETDIEDFDVVYDLENDLFEKYVKSNRELLSGRIVFTVA